MVETFVGDEREINKPLYERNSFDFTFHKTMNRLTKSKE